MHHPLQFIRQRDLDKDELTGSDNNVRWRDYLQVQRIYRSQDLPFILLKDSPYGQIALKSDRAHPSLAIPLRLQAYRHPETLYSNPSQSPSAMGSSSSKPSKHAKKKPAKTAISRPIPHHTPLSRPALEPTPLRPPPHHPAATRPTPEQEVADRYRHFFPPERTQKPEAAYRRGGAAAAAAAVSAPVAQQRSAGSKQKQKAPYQFRPLGKIGAAPKAAAAKPKPSEQPYQFRPLNEIGAPAGAARKNGAQRDTFRNRTCKYCLSLFAPPTYLPLYAHRNKTNRAPPTSPNKRNHPQPKRERKKKKKEQRTRTR